jgi:hypothetical protein
MATTAKPTQLVAESFDAFREANTASSNPRLFRGVTIIRSGLGNKRDKHLYPASAMKEAVDAGLFNDLRAFVDHPTSLEEQVQPERSVRDFCGVYRNPRFLAEGANGGRVVADLHILKSHDWVASGIRELAEMGLADKVGISILGSGVTVPDKYREGDQEFEVSRVKKFSKVRSADIVTQAGAGGGFSNFLESAREEALEQTDMDPKELLKQIAEAAAAGDTAKVKELTAQITEASDEADDDKAEEKAADDAADDSDDEDEDGEEEAKETKDDAATTVTEESKVEEDCGCGKGKKKDVAEAAAGAAAVATKKSGKRKKVGKKFGENESTDVTALQAELDALREENATLKGQARAKTLQTHIAKRLGESKLPATAKDKLKSKLALMESQADVDAEVAFAEALFVGVAETQFEEVEAGGGASHEGQQSTVEQKLQEAVVGVGLKFKE